ncbi:hypothetical protein H4CHR_04423 [Variovorax sp. PBS-H4]|uniref:hypothetical protein n=1 Tax=Variovorax sp. PBS-H4 TaxID=434008 RepID=UPI001317AA1E|nr:hypothetical protein [Variovorax sp. PBS-H4]VTU38431.1 hypothetical protein H4CHR_04423 [Variovorax sp. PBS-H4]
MSAQHTLEPKPHMVMRHGCWNLFASRKDASYWPFPELETRTVGAMSDAVARREQFRAVIAKTTGSAA